MIISPVCLGATQYQAVVFRRVIVEFHLRDLNLVAVIIYGARKILSSKRRRLSESGVICWGHPSDLKTIEQPGTPKCDRIVLFQELKRARTPGPHKTQFCGYRAKPPARALA